MHRCRGLTDRNDSENTVGWTTNTEYATAQSLDIQCLPNSGPFAFRRLVILRNISNMRDRRSTTQRNRYNSGSRSNKSSSTSLSGSFDGTSQCVTELSRATCSTPEKE
ncbi:hypothetical protein NXS19_014240 [Fusarium pseudograminearum]|nr:hypothetical protein NXS19_014240 [Fusarium pseudograminearum]